MTTATQPTVNDTAEQEPEEEADENLLDLINEFQGAITASIKRTYRPLYNPADDDREFPEVLRPPKGMQETAIRGTVHSLITQRGTNVCGEMGTGKSLIGIVAAKMAGFSTVLIICPPHLTRKWKREVEATLPDTTATAVIVNTVTDLRKLTAKYGAHGQNVPKDHTVYVIMSKERAKLSHGWKHEAFESLPMINGRPLWRNPEEDEREDEEDKPVTVSMIPSAPEAPESNSLKQARLARCPDCSAHIKDKYGGLLTSEELEYRKQKSKCADCGGALWSADRGRMRFNRIALATYIKKRMPRFFQLFVGDEIQDYKSRDSAQGLAAGGLAQMCHRSLTLTGTFMGGYASTLFYLLYRFSPEFRERWAFTGESHWIKSYGFVEEITRYHAGSAYPTADGAESGRRIVTSRKVREKPGLMPAALFHILRNTVFIRLSDVEAGLPPYKEHVVTLDMDQTKHEDDAHSQRGGYDELYEKLQDIIADAYTRRASKMLATYLQTLLAYPDAPDREQAPVDTETREVITSVGPLNTDKAYPKEEYLATLVKEERAKGRRSIIYVCHTETRDITPRLKGILAREGIRAEVLKSHTVKSEDREAWIQKTVAEGADAVICHPKLVQTGLDLLDFPTVIWYQTEYSVYTMRQASRRSWRIGQSHPVNVHYLTYSNCIQESALALVARKTQSSLAVEGELPEEGLSAYGDDDDNLIMALAKRITGNITDDHYDVHRAVAAMAQANAEADQLLVDDEWKIPERETETPTKMVKVKVGTAVATAGKETRPVPLEELTLTESGQIAMMGFEDLAAAPPKNGRRRRR